MRHVRTVRVLLILAGLAGLAVLAVFVIRGRHQAHVKQAVAVTVRRPPSLPHPAVGPNSKRRVTPRIARPATPATPATSATSATPATSATSATPATLDRALGQLIVARFAGPQPSPAFLERIRRGQIGGVILFADNLTGGPAGIRALIQELQHAASEGANPPLLVMTDQEGGVVRRIAGPPFLAPSEMASSATAFEQGQAAGSLLRAAGINLDLAPVADVEADTSSFLGSRAFGSSPALVADRACAFAAGLAKAGVGYTLKHFPGLGRASTSTDDAPVSIEATSADLRADYLAYAKCANNPRALVMVSSAIYPSLTGPLPAVMSPLTYQHELPVARTRADVATISDDLQARALADQPTVARTAINAGLDMAMYAGTEDASAQAYELLEHDVTGGQISPGRLRQAAEAVLRLKQAIQRR